MNQVRCARCQKTVYPIEELKCLDKIWHKGCFKCQECNMTLNMKTYKGFSKLPYCAAHCPKATHTTVADTPEARRLAENTKIQSNVKYHEDFEKSKGKVTQVADDPETLRIKAASKVISNVEYHGEYARKKQMEEKRTLLDDGSTRPPQQVLHPSSTNGLSNSGQIIVGGNMPPPSNMANTGVNQMGIAVGMRQPNMGMGMGMSGVPINHAPPAAGDANHHAMQATHRYMMSSSQNHANNAGPQLTHGYTTSISTQSHVNHGPNHGPQPQHGYMMNATAQSQLQNRARAQEQIMTNAMMNSSPNRQQQVHYTGMMPQTMTTGSHAQQAVRRPGLPPRTFRAMYDYTAQDDDEVSFMDGDVIINCESIDEGWMTGTVQRTGLRGMLPANYVQPIN